MEELRTKRGKQRKQQLELVLVCMLLLGLACIISSVIHNLLNIN